MARRGRGEFVLSVLAAAFWSPAIYVTMRAAAAAMAGAQDGRLPEAWMTTFHFYVVLWAAAVCGGFMLLTGRLSELSALRRREVHLLVLAALGGYALWLLRALALERTMAGLTDAGVGRLTQAHMLFYAGPLLLGLLSVPSREGARAREIGVLILGFVGAILIARSFAADGAAVPTTAATRLLALGSALCWALFVLLARPAARENRALPVLTTVLGLGATCMMVTCLTTGGGLLTISARALWLSMIVGGVSVGLGLLCWVTALSIAPAAKVAPVWYLAMAFGLVWAHVIGRCEIGWLALPGAGLILVAVYAHVAGHGSRGATGEL